MIGQDRLLSLMLPHTTTHFQRLHLLHRIREYQIGDRVEVGYSVTAREWDGKWFNNVDLISIKFLDEVAPTAPVPVAQPAPVARQAAPRKVARPARTTPIIPSGANLEPQDDDMPF